MTCTDGLPGFTYDENYGQALPKACPAACLRQEADWSFPSQTDEVFVRKCRNFLVN